MIDPMEEFFFDLHGYTILRAALDSAHMAAINDWVDALPPLKQDDWLGPMEVQSYGGIDGINLQNIVEGGEIFERLIDHPSWIGRVCHYLGTYHNPYINEVFLNLRGQGGYIGVHSGGWKTDGRVRSGVHGGQWNMQYVSVIVALDDIGPGDGATVLIPGSHKAAFRHPQQEAGVGITDRPGQEIAGIEEVYLQAGDAVLFNDMVIHGSAGRTNPGFRRTLIFRYLPHLYAHRWGYVPSDELLARLTPERRKILQAIEPHRPPARH
jgi:hypothetical protein